MTKDIIVGIVGVFQIILSISLIVRKKNKWAIFCEIVSSLVLFGYLIGFSTEAGDDFIIYFFMSLTEYLFVKIILVLFMIITRYSSFYIIKASCKRKKKANSLTIKFACTFSKVRYWPALKLGLPGMAGKRHSKTKVKFDENGFPKFKAYSTINLRRKYWHETRERHFYMANKILFEETQRNARVCKKFTRQQIQGLANGITPNGFVWHHHQDAGVLQLVEEKLHSKTHHIGGYTIWGNK